MGVDVLCIFSPALPCACMCTPYTPPLPSPQRTRAAHDHILEERARQWREERSAKRAAALAAGATEQPSERREGQRAVSLLRAQSPSPAAPHGARLAGAVPTPLVAVLAAAPIAAAAGGGQVVPAADTAVAPAGAELQPGWPQPEEARGVAMPVMQPAPCHFEVQQPDTLEQGAPAQCANAAGLVSLQPQPRPQPQPQPCSQLATPRAVQPPTAQPAAAPAPLTPQPFSSQALPGPVPCTPGPLSPQSLQLAALPAAAWSAVEAGDAPGQPGCAAGGLAGQLSAEAVKASEESKVRFGFSFFHTFPLGHSVRVATWMGRGGGGVCVHGDASGSSSLIWSLQLAASRQGAWEALWDHWARALMVVLVGVGRPMKGGSCCCRC